MINLKIILITALLIEIITIFGRFYLKIRTKDIIIRLIKYFNLKIFIQFHHLFIGIILALIFYPYKIIFNMGLGIALSDIIHHFILWLIMGDPEFHIIYKNIKYYKKETEKETRKIRKVIKHIVHYFK